MKDSLFTIIADIRAGEELIISGYGIDEKVITALLGPKLSIISKIRLIYHRRTLRNPGYLEYVKENRAAIIRTPVGFEKNRSSSIFHSKIFAIVSGEGRDRKIRRIGLSSFNWSSYHFSASRSVIDSLVVWNGADMDGVDAVLKRKEFSSSQNYKLVLIKPTLVLVQEKAGHGTKLEIVESGITSRLQQACPSQVEIIAAPYITARGLKLLAPPTSIEGARIFYAPARIGSTRLHGKFLIGRDEDSKQVAWFGSLNFTENAVSGNNHEVVVVSVSFTERKKLVRLLEKFVLWDESKPQVSDTEAEPDLPPYLPIDAPVNAKLGFRNESLFVEMRFSGAHRRLGEALLRAPSGKFVRIDGRRRKAGRSLELHFRTGWKKSDELREVMRSIQSKGHGMVTLNVGHDTCELDLDLGFLWEELIITMPPPEIPEKGKKAPKKRHKDKISFTGEDVRPLRMLRGELSGNLRAFQNWMNSRDFDAKMDWVNSWTSDSWLEERKP